MESTLLTIPNCNTVLLGENSIFEPEIQTFSPGNCESLARIRSI